MSADGPTVFLHELDIEIDPELHDMCNCTVYSASRSSVLTAIDVVCV